MESKAQKYPTTSIRLSPTLKRRIDNAAQRLGMRKSTFMKACIAVVLASEGEGKRAKP